MRAMFQNCQNLTSLNVSNFDTSNVEDIGYMFCKCFKLTSLDVSNWNTSNVTNMEALFWHCAKLSSLDVSSWNTQNLKYMGSIFRQLPMETVNVSSWNTSKIINMDGSFADSSKFKYFDLSNFYGGEQLLNISFLFSSNTNMHTVNLINLSPPNVTNTGNMFYKCISLHTLKFPNMGMIKADTENNLEMDLSACPLGTAGDESKEAFLYLFSYDRVANGLTNPLIVKLSSASSALLTDTQKAEITSRGYTLA